MNKYKITKLIFISLSLSLMLVACNKNLQLYNYKGTPFKDESYKNSPQKIPGKLECEYYDLGGEGVAFHDTDKVNSGSGGLNKADGSYLHEFRKNEAVDISYTKFQNPAIDNNEYNFVDPIENDLYIGWTEEGEWIKYTIDVEKTATYNLGIMYTANQNAKIAFAINNQIIAENIEITSTYVAQDTVAFRQWHHWNYLEDIASIELKKGVQTFTIHIVENGNMNLNYINFEPLK